MSDYVQSLFNSYIKGGFSLAGKTHLLFSNSIPFFSLNSQRHTLGADLVHFFAVRQSLKGCLLTGLCSNRWLCLLKVTQCLPEQSKVIKLQEVHSPLVRYC